MNKTLPVLVHLRKQGDGPEATTDELVEAIDTAVGILVIGPDRQDTRYFGDVELGKASPAGFMKELRQHEPGCSDCDAYVAHVRGALGLKENQS